jgi:hypothetical protein
MKGAWVDPRLLTRYRRWRHEIARSSRPALSGAGPSEDSPPGTPALCQPEQVHVAPSYSLGCAAAEEHSWGVGDRRSARGTLSGRRERETESARQLGRRNRHVRLAIRLCPCSVLTPRYTLFLPGLFAMHSMGTIPACDLRTRQPLPTLQNTISTLPHTSVSRCIADRLLAR